jgi:hypothetical protein
LAVSGGFLTNDSNNAWHAYFAISKGVELILEKQMAVFQSRKNWRRGEGFEPPRRFWRLAVFADCCLKPLSHLSAIGLLHHKFSILSILQTGCVVELQRCLTIVG